MYDIFSLPGPNNSESDACGISSGGNAAGVAYGPTSEPGEAGLIWMGGRFHFALGWDSHSILYGVNRSGDAVGVRGMNNSPTQIPILVRAGEVHDFATAVGLGSLATGINDAGLVCGWSSNNKSFVYDSHANNVTHWIDPLPGMAGSFAIAINTFGNVVGHSPDQKYNDHGFFYDGALKDLGPTGFIEDLNDSNIVCGSVGKPSAYYWVPANWDATLPSPAPTELPVPDGFIGGHGMGINNKGEVVGTCWTQETYNSKKQSAFIYSGGVSTDLNKLISNPEWHLEIAEDIDDDSQITGSGTYKGRQMAFLLKPQSTMSLHITLPGSFDIVIGNVIVDGRGWIVRPGQPPIPVPPPELWVPLDAAKSAALMGLILDELSMYITDRGTREKVRTDLLEGVRTSLNRLMKSIGESPALLVGEGTGAATAPAMEAGRLEISARRFQFRGKT